MESNGIPIVTSAKTHSVIPRLPLKSGERKGSEFRLALGTTTLGRSRDNDIPLDDPSMSRFHARIFERDSRLHIQDLGGTTGTFVNNDPIVLERPLRHGDIIRVGTNEMIFFQETVTVGL